MGLPSILGLGTNFPDPLQLLMDHSLQGHQPGLLGLDLQSLVKDHTSLVCALESWCLLLSWTFSFLSTYVI